ncbi:MAG TPA: helix-turn-helix domain-containing protein [Candidatus Limnocylindrales bacterium]|nr:helix-turn-helix domain-containing protein [Candidatus Limnocylindrales bacterium]
MASRAPTGSAAARADGATGRTLDALLDELAPVRGPLLAAYRERSAAPATIRCRGRIAAGEVRRLLPASDTVDGDAIQEIPARGGVPWTRLALSTGEACALIVAARGPLEVADRMLLEAAALRAVRSLVLDRERRAGDRLRQLLVTARRAVASLDLDEVLAGIVRDATELLHGKSGDMLLLDPDRRALRVVAVSNFPPDMLGFELRFGDGVSSQAIRRRRAIQVEDYRAYEHRAPGLERYDFGAVLCAPLLFRDEAIGALNVHSGRPGLRFSEADVELLTAFASHAAIAIDHARRYANEVRLGRDLAETNRELTRSLEVQQRLAEQVILDGGAAGIAAVLARDLRRRVVIEDHLHRTIAGASPDGSTDWRGLTARAGGPARTGGEGAAEPFSVAVRVGREVVGHLLLSDEGELGQIDRALIDIATTGVALEFAKTRAALEVEERLRGEAVGDLLAGSYVSPAAIARRAARLGYDLDEPRDLIVIRIHDEEGRGPAGPASTPDSPSRGTARPLAAIRERLAIRHPGSIAAVHGGAIVVLATRDRGGPDDPRALADDLRRALEALAIPGPVTIALGVRCEQPDDYPRAYRETREALELMVRLGRAGTTIGVRELGPYALLLRATSRDDLEAFARRTLEPLLAYERAHGGELLRTLRVHLEEDRVQRRTAARCFVHVNTVVYRLRRIEELLGISLDDPQAVFDLTLALRITDLLEPPAG